MNVIGRVLEYFSNVVHLLKLDDFDELRETVVIFKMLNFMLIYRFFING